MGKTANSGSPFLSGAPSMGAAEVIHPLYPGCRQQILILCATRNSPLGNITFGTGLPASTSTVSTGVAFGPPCTRNSWIRRSTPATSLPKYRAEYALRAFPAIPRGHGASNSAGTLPAYQRATACRAKPHSCRRSSAAEWVLCVPLGQQRLMERAFGRAPRMRVEDGLVDVQCVEAGCPAQVLPHHDDPAGPRRLVQMPVADENQRLRILVLREDAVDQVLACPSSRASMFSFGVPVMPFVVCSYEMIFQPSAIAWLTKSAVADLAQLNCQLVRKGAVHRHVVRFVDQDSALGTRQCHGCGRFRLAQRFHIRIDTLKRCAYEGA